MITLKTHLPKAKEIHDIYREEFMNVESLDTPKLEGDELSFTHMLADMVERADGAYIADSEKRASVAAYLALESELWHQFQFLTQVMGVRFSFTIFDPVPPDGVPSYRYMRDRYKETDTLEIFKSNPGEHPYLTGHVLYPYYNYEDGIRHALYANDIFRAVHDYFGHLSSGGNFSERGEKVAYLSHRALFSPLAHEALFTETVMQRAYYETHGKFAPQIPNTFGHQIKFDSLPLDVTKLKGIISNTCEEVIEL